MKTNITTICLMTLLVASGCDRKDEARFIPEGAKLERCAVHGASTKRDRVPIQYGLRAVFQDYAEAQHTLFPNAWRDISGGCIPCAPTKATVHYCPKCRDAEERWRKTHEKPSFQPTIIQGIRPGFFPKQ